MPDAQIDPAQILAADRPAVYFANKIGDAIVSLPMLRALKQQFREPITVLCPKMLYDLCFHEISPQFVDIAHVLPSELLTPLPVTDDVLDAVVAQIGPVDVFINAVPCNVPTQLVTDRLKTRLGAETNIGFASYVSDYDIVIPREDGHEADRIFKLAQLFDPLARIEDHAQPLPFPPGVLAQARSIREGVPAGRKVLVVHADTEWTAKQWSFTRFIDLLDRFLGRHPEYVAWIVGMGFEDLDVGREGGRVTPMLGSPLDLTMALIATADLFLGVDSSMLHAADLARVPGVGLFGPTRSATWGFRFGPHRHIDRPSMSDIGVADVLEALDQLA